jgi:superfamily II DNA or RNA helicase
MSIYTQLIKQVEKRTDNLIEIYNEIYDDDKCHDQLELVKDSFEVCDGLLNCIEENDKYNPKFFDKLKLAIIRSIKEDLSIDIIKEKYQKQSNYILDYLLDDLNNIIIEDENEETDSEEVAEIDDNIENNINNFNWRTHQINAINETRSQNFKCGIHHMIMGSGKSYILLKLIQEHYNIFQKRHIYIIVCDKQEVLRKMFFDGTILDKEKVNFWKKYNIIDLTIFHIIDCINIKPTELNYNKKKPNILIINNDYLQSLEKKNKINWAKVSLIQLDECHSVSGSLFYNLLHKIKYTYNKSIIGYSATPLRNKAEDKLKDIFSRCMDGTIQACNKKVNIISHYDLMMAISDEIVLPFTCEYVEIRKTKKNCIGAHNLQITQTLFSNIISKLPYKKLIMWCRKKDHMTDYYKFFKQLYGQRYDIYCTSSFDAELTKKGYNTNLDEFYKKKNNAILFCINRCREGSDIQNVDCGMFLDGVRKRSTLVSMQTGGRIMRPDTDKKKSRAFLIDTFICDGSQSVELFTINKVITYYNKLLNLAEESNEYTEYYNDMMKIASQTVIDEKSETIYIKVDDNNKHNIELKIQMLTKKIDWDILKQLIKTEIDSKFKISKPTQFNQIINKLKELEIFTVNCKDFWKVYNNIPKNTKDKYFLPIDFYDKYKELFDKTTWYKLLEFDTSKWYPDVETCISKMEKNKFISLKNISKQYYQNECLKHDQYLPPNPKELFKLQGFTNYNIFNKN